MTIQNALLIAKEKLKNVTNVPQKEAQILLLSILKKELVWLHLNFDYLLDDDIVKKFFLLVDKRAKFYPIEYILNRVDFYGEEFFIEDGVLIPRPETEILIDKTMQIAKKFENQNIVEVGIGSGIISIMLKKLLKSANIIGVDINQKALNLANKNAKKFNVDINFKYSNLLKEVKVKDFDICVSNPPYIANDYNLPKNVEYEPKNALFGGKKGDELIKNLIKEVYNNKIKYFICEFGYDQKKPIYDFLQDFNTNYIEFYKDYSNFDRGFIVEFNYN